MGTAFENLTAIYGVPRELIASHFYNALLLLSNAAVGIEGGGEGSCKILHCSRLRVLVSNEFIQNGVGAYILQCKRIDFHYCDWAGSSRGMNAFVKHHLPSFAKLNPQIEIHVAPRPNHHPIMRGHYINGKELVFCVRNLEKSQILQKANELRSASGDKPKKVKKPVESTNESVRGIWSGLHGGKPIVIGEEGKMKERSIF